MCLGDRCGVEGVRLLHDVWGGFQLNSDRIRFSWQSLPELEKGLEEGKTSITICSAIFQPSSSSSTQEHMAGSCLPRLHLHQVFWFRVADIRASSLQTVLWGGDICALQDIQQHPCLHSVGPSSRPATPAASTKRQWRPLLGTTGLHERTNRRLLLQAAS